jgi:RimJ/RimL family protein N-acetyltransferase
MNPAWETDPLPLVTRRGRGVLLRLLSPADSAEVAAFLGRLSPRTLYLRYFAPLPALAGDAALREAARLLSGDAGRLALAAVERADGTIVAVAELAWLGAAPSLAEIALAVADPYQGEGIGRALSNQLAALARQQGVTALTATLLRENRAVRRLLDGIGAPYRIEGFGPTASVRINLGA